MMIEIEEGIYDGRDVKLIPQTDYERDRLRLMWKGISSGKEVRVTLIGLGQGVAEDSPPLSVRVWRATT